MLERNLTPALLAALADTPVVFLAGARQVGKKTLVRAMASGPHPARYLSFDDLTALAAVQSDPQGFVSGLDGPVVRLGSLSSQSSGTHSPSLSASRQVHQPMSLIPENTGMSHTSLARQSWSSWHICTQVLSIQLAQSRPSSQGSVELWFGLQTCPNPSSSDSKQSVLPPDVG